MKTILTIIVLTLSFTSGYGQFLFEPQILILPPNETTYDKILEPEILRKDKELNLALNQDVAKMDLEKMKDQPNNIRIMIENEIAFLKKIDFAKSTSYKSEQFLIYLFFERFPNLLITLLDKKCDGNISDLQKIANDNSSQYILNFPKINFYQESGVSKAKVSVQLFDISTNEIILNKDFIGDWHNPGSEFCCKDSSLDCTINNALSEALFLIADIISKKSPKLQNEKLLYQNRLKVLTQDYLNKPFDTTFIKNLSLPNDCNIDNSMLFQALVNDSKTKFIAFYLSKADDKKLHLLTGEQNDKNVSIITMNHDKNSNNPDKTPMYYAYTLAGLKYQDKWYYQKSNVNYFEQENIEASRIQFFNDLQNWSFFKENSTDFDPEFWEKNQFARIKDLRQDPNWDKYGKSIWEMEERENRDYIGLYEIVANDLKKIKAEEDSLYRFSLSDSIFKPFYETQKKLNPIEFSNYSLLPRDEFIFIFPKSKEVVLNPIQITNNKGESSIRYFLFLKENGQLFEWTYFMQHPFDDNSIDEHIWHYGTIVMSQLSSLVNWNFSYNTFDDNIFWKQYVLAKSGNNYKYLRLIK